MTVSEQQSPVKRHKAINKFSSEVDKAINILKDLDFGIYKRDILKVEKIIDVVTFIDNNVFIKEQTGKGIKLLSKFNYGYDGIEIYNHYKKLDCICKTIEELDI